MDSGTDNLQDITKNFREAVDLVMGELSYPVDNILVIGNLSNCFLIIEYKKGNEGDKFLCIFKINPNKTRDILHKSLFKKYKDILFVNLNNVDITVRPKMLKITFLFCQKSKVSIRGGSIGPVEFIRSRDLIVDLRDYLIPVCRIDMSQSINFFQRLDESVYAVCKSSKITSAFIDPDISDKRLEHISLSSEDQEFFFLSKDVIEKIRNVKLLEEPIRSEQKGKFNIVTF